MKRFLTRRRIGAVILIAGIALAVYAIPKLVTALFPPETCSDQPPAVTSGSGQWIMGAPIPTIRGETRGDALDGMVYFIGGMMDGWEASALVDRYDPVADVWESRASLPTVTNHPGETTLDGKIYVSGGFNTIDFTFNLKALWRYDPETNTWEQLADMPEVRAAHIMKAIKGKLYVVGGDGPTDPTSVWMYDPETNTWTTTLANMTSPRDHLAGAVFNDKLYVMGGRWRNSQKFSITEVYDPATDTWTTLADMPVPRSGLTADLLSDGKIHVTGGEDIDMFCTYSEHDAYDPVTNTWSREPNLPRPRHGLASAAVGDRWYVIGGATSAGPYTQHTFKSYVDIWVPNS